LVTGYADKMDDLNCFVGLASGNDLTAVEVLASALQWPQTTVTKLQAWNWPKKGVSTVFDRVKGMLGYLVEKWMELCCDYQVSEYQARLGGTNGLFSSRGCQAPGWSIRQEKETKHYRQRRR
jgi:hypothetical protein